MAFQPFSYSGAGESYARLNDFAAAETLFRKAKSADAANQLGLIFARQNRSSDAKEWFQRAISIRRDHTGAINNLGVLYVKLGQSNDAVAAFRYGIEIAPEDETLYMNLGRVYVSMGDREKAREVMRQLLSKKPGDPAATRALRELETDNRRP